MRLTAPDGSTLDVASTGKPYPVATASPPGTPGFTVRFSLWNRAYHARPPYDVVMPAQARAFAKRFVTRREAGAAKSIANVAVRPSAISATTERFRAPGMAVEFDYPSAFRPVTLTDDRIGGQSLGSATRAAVGISPYDLLVVDRFAGRAVPVTQANIADLAPGFDSLISGGAGHPVKDRIGTARGLVAVFFAPFANPAAPAGVRETILNVFTGDDEYELRCQSSPARRAEVNRACGEMIATLGVVGGRPQPPVDGATLPVR